MCGIFGALSDRVDDVDIDAALHAIAHRGPDAHGVWRDGRMVLGHTRLAIIDLSDGGAQPMRSIDGRVVITFNGEIYNHLALRKELEQLGHTFRSRSDTEVIVEGYRAWGDDVIRRLDGMFAFGIWDSERQRLLLARDRAGKKPLFYTREPRGMRFASEVKSLRASGLPATIDTTSLPYLLAFGYVPAPRTMYRDVESLPPASLLVVERDGAARVVRYWRAQFGEPTRNLTLGEATLEVRRLTTAAVERRLEADVPLGAFLSGGLDSTIVVGLMAQKLGEKVKTFSIGFSGDPAYDETRFARIASRAFRTEHTEFTLDPVSFELIEQLVAMHDGPFGDSSAIPTSIVASLTRQHVTVALSGDGSDELFCGYLRFLVAEATEGVPQPLRHALRTLTARWPSTGRERSLVSRAQRLFNSIDAPLADRLYRLPPFFASQLDEVLRPELRSEVAREYDEKIVAEAASSSVLKQILHHNFETYLPYDLLVKADRASMMHSLEVRAPFLDTALIEVVTRLPDSYLRRGTTTKWILRRAFADLVPREIMRRGKMGFGVPLGAWFRSDLRDYLREQLGPSSPIYDFVEERHVASLLYAHLANRADHGQRLWLLLTLAIWLRTL